MTDDLLSPFEITPGYHWLMTPLYHLAVIFKITSIEWVFEDGIEGRYRHGVSPRSLALKIRISPLFIGDVGYLRWRITSCEEEFPHFFDESKPNFIFHNGPSILVIKVSLRSFSGELPLVYFASEASFYVLREVEDILIRHSCLYAEEESGILWVIDAIARDNTLDESFLEHVLYSSGIYRISRYSIEFPAEDTVNMSFAYLFAHFLECFSDIRGFGWFFFGIHLDDFYSFFFCFLFPVGNLVFNRLDLPVFSFRGFPCIEHESSEIVHSNIN